MSVKIFTIEEANQALPHVEETLRFIREKAVEVVERQDRLAVLALIGADGEKSPEYMEWVEARLEIEERAQSYKEKLEELNALGVVLKDLNHGLVDFYCRKDDRLVFLCWRLGEATVSHWHEIDGGFSGRRPVSEL